MGTSGRPSKASPAQSAEVRRLSAAGLSIRSIAKEVFGDVRLRGRVERILNRPADAAEEPEAVRAREAELTEFGRLNRAGQLRWLLDRRLAAWAAREGGPSGRELLALLSESYPALWSFEEIVLELAADPDRFADRDAVSVAVCELGCRGLIRRVAGLYLATRAAVHALRQSD